MLGWIWANLETVSPIQSLSTREHRPAQQPQRKQYIFIRQVEQIVSLKIKRDIL